MGPKGRKGRRPSCRTTTCSLKGKTWDLLGRFGPSSPLRGPPQGGLGPGRPNRISPPAAHLRKKTGPGPPAYACARVGGPTTTSAPNHQTSTRARRPAGPALGPATRQWTSYRASSATGALAAKMGAGPHDTDHRGRQRRTGVGAQKGRGPPCGAARHLRRAPSKLPEHNVEVIRPKAGTGGAPEFWGCGSNGLVFQSVSNTACCELSCRNGGAGGGAGGL